jgi:hypothetical protein
MSSISNGPVSRETGQYREYTGYVPVPLDYPGIVTRDLPDVKRNRKSVEPRPVPDRSTSPVPRPPPPCLKIVLDASDSFW